MNLSTKYRFYLLAVFLLCVGACLLSAFSPLGLINWLDDHQGLLGLVPLVLASTCLYFLVRARKSGAMGAGIADQLLFLFLGITKRKKNEKDVRK